MRTLRKLSVLALPLTATLATASLASADTLIAYLEGAGLAQGTIAFNCNVTDNGGRRAHIQATAFGESRDRADIAQSLESGTSAGTQMGFGGARHKVKLQTHLNDTTPGGEEVVIDHCATGWSAGWTSSGTTNVMQCTRSLRAATTRTGGSCSSRNFTAASMGNLNN